jgi:hypothetical protein
MEEVYGADLSKKNRCTEVIKDLLGQILTKRKPHKVALIQLEVRI